jgi:hypothetical protein
VAFVDAHAGHLGDAVRAEGGNHVIGPAVVQVVQIDNGAEAPRTAPV